MTSSSSPPIDLAVLIPMPQPSRDALAEAYRVHYWPDAKEHPRLLATPEAKTIRAVQTNGSFGIKRPMIEAMPALEIVCVVGAGFEGVDLAATRERGIVVTTGAGTNAPWVAEHAWALLLAVVRGVVVGDERTRAHRWHEAGVMMPAVTGKRLGILGLGNIGREIAKRGAAFDMEIAYWGRAQKPGVSYRYFERLQDLAAWCDALVVAAPGGPATRHVVNADVLTALGPTGYLVNIARGSLVDSEALAQALRDGRIAGAGLDVFEGEPRAPESLLVAPNVVFTPHIAGNSVDSIAAMIRKVRANLDAHFAGKPVLSPVPV